MKSFYFLAVLALVFFYTKAERLGSPEKDPTKDIQSESIAIEEFNTEDDELGSRNLQTTSSPRDIVVIVWDGAANKKTILQAFKTARNEVSGWRSIKGFWISGYSSLSYVKNKIDDVVAQHGKNPENLLLLLVGKSLGGAKSYKLLSNYATPFQTLLPYFNGLD